MADETHNKLREENLRRLKTAVAALAVIYVMTFLSGFLQATRFNFFNYIFFFLLFFGGIALLSTTVKSKATGKKCATRSSSPGESLAKTI